MTSAPYLRQSRTCRLVLASLASFILAMNSLGCGGSLPGQTLSNPAKTLASLAISPQNPSTPLGNNQQFTASGVFSDKSSQDMTKTAAWSSSQPNVATIDASGMAVSKTVGKTVITAVSGSVTTSVTLTVSSAVLVSIAVTPANPSLIPGRSVQLVATGTFSDGSHQDISTSVSWASNASVVAAVSQKGVATGMSAGSATITASSGSINGTDTLTVAGLVGISVSPAGPTIPLGENQPLTATGTFGDGSTLDFTGKVLWNSSSPGIASVTSAGLATGLAIGTSTITATSGTITGTDLVTVGPPALVSISIAPASASIAIGSTAQFNALGTYSDGSTQDVTNTASWASADPNVASIGQTGLAVALSIGTTTIMDSSGSVTGSATLSVKPLLAVTYFANATTLGIDATVRASNPGVTGGNLCAMIYVFDQNQELNECCGCLVTPDGLRTLSLSNDLTANPLTGIRPTTGVVKIVPADAASNPSCNAASISPAGSIVAWSTNIQSVAPNVFTETETRFLPTALSDEELSALQNQCAFANSLGSGQGVCTCGTGD